LSLRASLKESLQAGDCASKDERVNIVGALVSIDRFEIGEVAHDGERGRNPIGAEHIARQAGNIERLARIVALDERDRFRGASLPASNSRPMRNAAGSPSAISVCMSASFFWIS
jgi:hypothetical protein